MMFQRAALLILFCSLPALVATAQDPYRPAPSFSGAESYPPNTGYQSRQPGYQNPAPDYSGGYGQQYQPQSYQPQNGPPPGGGYVPSGAPADGYTPGAGYPPAGRTPPPAPGDALQPAANFEQGTVPLSPPAAPPGAPVGNGLQDLSRLPALDPQTGELPLDGSAPPPGSGAGGEGAGNGGASGEEVVIEESDIVIEETGYVSVFSTEYWDPWEGSIEFGLNGTSGNSDTLSIKAAGNAKFEDEWRKHTFSITHVNTQQDGVNTAENTIGDIRGEWKFPPGPWSLYVHEMTELDEFKNFDARVAIDAGVGYAILNNDYTKLSTRAGGSTSREFGGSDDEWVPELAFGLDWRWNLSKTSKINVTVDYFPEIGDFENYRMNTKADWETVLNADWGMSMKLGIFNRYDSTPNGAKPNDLNYSVTLLWSF